jgi:hypothetical protein
MIADHLTGFHGLLGLAIQAVIWLPARRKAGRFCFVERSRDPANVAIKKIEATN